MRVTTAAKIDTKCKTFCEKKPAKQDTIPPMYKSFKVSLCAFSCPVKSIFPSRKEMSIGWLGGVEVYGCGGSRHTVVLSLYVMTIFY